MLVYNKKRTPKIIADRDFLGRSVWKKEGEGFLLVTSPEESMANHDGNWSKGRSRSAVENRMGGRSNDGSSEVWRTGTYRTGTHWNCHFTKYPDSLLH